MRNIVAMLESSLISVCSSFSLGGGEFGSEADELDLVGKTESLDLKFGHVVRSTYLWIDFCPCMPDEAISSCSKMAGTIKF